MEPKMICQSCTMPIDAAEDRGTEMDGSKSKEYCKYCLRNGAFTDPGMSFEQMQTTVKTEMKKRNIPDNIIQHSLDSLANLKRWKKAKA